MSSTKQAQKPPTGKKLGRPPIRCRAIEDEICRRIGQGQSLAEICREDHLPNRSNIFLWIIADERLKGTPDCPPDLFCDRYARARRQQAETWAEQIVSIADDGEQDMPNDAVGRSRLRIDTRKWIMSKLLPNKYGDRPAEVNVETHLHQHIPVQRLRELQERHAKALEG